MSFLTPAILGAFLVLPIIYYILRVMPPHPQRIVIPTWHFIQDLSSENTTPNNTPWWILLLRLLMASLVILALAGPVTNRNDDLSGTRADILRVVIDNGWASASTWGAQMRAAETILEQAARDRREVILTATASDLELSQNIMSAGEALSRLKTLEPHPWPSKYDALADKPHKPAITYWFGHGLDDTISRFGGNSSMANLMRKFDDVTYYRPPAERLPVALTLADNSANTKTLNIRLMHSLSVPAGTPFTLQALDSTGGIIDQQRIEISTKSGNDTVHFEPGNISSIRIAGQRSAGSIYHLDDTSSSRHIGIIADKNTDENTPLIGAGFYLKRAMEPFTSLSIGNVSDVLEENPSLIVLPDIADLPPDSLSALEDWTENGGLLLRFAGPIMADNSEDIPLTPVGLRSGGRALDGELTWEKPLSIAPFAESSPFFGLPFYEDVLVRRTILAEPEEDLELKIWASLSDGTPLISGAPLGSGLSVLIHTTATPDWSDLALSGLYVDILERLTRLSGRSFSSLDNQNHTTLNPIWVMDGYGTKTKAGGNILPLDLSDDQIWTPSAQHPPGLYGSQSFERAFNLGDSLDVLRSAKGYGTAITYGTDYEVNYMPHLLTLAFLLLLLDWAIMIMLSGAMARLPFRNFAKTALLCGLLLPAATAQAQNAPLETFQDLHLAYVTTGNATVDTISAQGLNTIAKELDRRTSTAPGGVKAVRIEKDLLLPYPFLYWPMTPNQKPLSREALEKIQDYLNRGGSILFDTRGRGRREHQESLRRILAPLNVPALHPMPDDHVLGKSFYLLSEFPGLYRGDTLWIEKNTGAGRDGVSSVIIGAHDWAAAWAAYGGGNRIRQNDLAVRFGINMALYALTGNYKADQVHVPYILERLGE